MTLCKEGRDELNGPEIEFNRIYLFLLKREGSEMNLRLSHANRLGNGAHPISHYCNRIFGLFDLTFLL